MMRECPASNEVFARVNAPVGLAAAAINVVEAACVSSIVVAVMSEPAISKPSYVKGLSNEVIVLLVQHSCADFAVTGCSGRSPS
tara:strand:- start:158 stop:409 length:252 start_codon:yes stop_codon:yes gene_type:complete